MTLALDSELLHSGKWRSKNFLNPELRYTKLYYHSFLYWQSFSIENATQNQREHTFKVDESQPCYAIYG
jgi:hypothetical protein